MQPRWFTQYPVWYASRGCSLPGEGLCLTPFTCTTGPHIGVPHDSVLWTKYGPDDSEFLPDETGLGDKVFHIHFVLKATAIDDGSAHISPVGTGLYWSAQHHQPIQEAAKRRAPAVARDGERRTGLVSCNY